MAFDKEKTERFIKAVTADADEIIEDIGIEADTEKMHILGDAERRAREEAEKYVNEHPSQGSVFLKDVSSAELDMKKTVLRRREELITEVFENTSAMIEEFRRSGDYADHLARAAVSAVTEGAVVYLAPADMKYENTIRKAAGSLNITFEQDKNIRLGGLSVYRPDSRTSADLTFDTALDEQRRIFAAGDPFGLNSD